MLGTPPHPTGDPVRRPTLACLPILATLLAAGCAADTPPACDFSLHLLAEDGRTRAERILGPEHVEAVVPADSGGRDISFLEAKLTPEGARLHRAFTDGHKGRRVEIACGAKVVAKPTVSGDGGASIHFAVD